jgi:hypothetical protein
MKKETYKTLTISSAIIWFIFTLLAVWLKYDLGTIATLGGIAIMFAWTYEQANIRD